MNTIKESGNRGFGCWEALTILTIPVMACVATWGLFDLAVQGSVTALAILLVSFAVMSVPMTLGTVILLKRFDRRRHEDDLAQLQQIAATQNALATGLVRIADGNQRAALVAQKQLAGHKPSDTLPPALPAVPVVFEGDFEIEAEVTQ